MSYLRKLKIHKKIIVIKGTLREVLVLVYHTYNRICALDINAQKVQGYTEIKPTLLFSAADRSGVRLSFALEDTPLF